MSSSGLFLSVSVAPAPGVEVAESGRCRAAETVLEDGPGRPGVDTWAWRMASAGAVAVCGPFLLLWWGLASGASCLIQSIVI